MGAKINILDGNFMMRFSEPIKCIYERNIFITCLLEAKLKNAIAMKMKK